MISAISWIPKGVCKPVPVVSDPPSKEEIEEMLKNGTFEPCDTEEETVEEEEMEEEDEMEEDDKEESKKVDEVAQALVAAGALGRINDGLEGLNMDNYDDEDDGVDVFSRGDRDIYHKRNERDPYLIQSDDDDSEAEDMIIKETDSVIVCARNEDDVSRLEVFIYEDIGDGEPNMYVHHDFIIPAFPLCTAWLDCPLKGGEKGNFLAVGSMEPSIEIWDLDIIDEVQPFLVLGGLAEKQKKKNGKKASIKYKKGSHTDSVLGLAWNKEFRNILASASADNLVKIWDVSTGKCDITMDHHTDKVQAVAWNHRVPQVLVSGSFDQTVVMKDGRQPSHPGFKWSVAADVESLAWDPHTEHSFVVSLEDGTVKGFDIRAANSDPSGSKPCFTLHAHDKSVSSVSFNPAAPNLLATGSTDKTVKLWDLSNNQPSCIATKNPKAGAIFFISFSEDNPFLLAIGGSNSSKEKLDIWDTMTEDAVARRFGKYRGSTANEMFLKFNLSRNFDQCLETSLMFDCQTYQFCSCRAISLQLFMFARPELDLSHLWFKFETCSD